MKATIEMSQEELGRLVKTAGEQLANAHKQDATLQLANALAAERELYVKAFRRGATVKDVVTHLATNGLPLSRRVAAAALRQAGIRASLARRKSKTTAGNGSDDRTNSADPGNGSQTPQ